MEWISVDEKLPNIGDKCWYFFDIVGKHRGWYEGLYVDEEGKEWSNIEFLFDLFDIQERRTVLYFIKLWENVLVNYRAEKSERKRKAEERKNSSGSAGNFTHNIRG